LEKNDNDTKGADAIFLQNSEAKYVIIGIPEDIEQIWKRPGQLQHGNCN
jgi:hypothetical protein